MRFILIIGILILMVSCDTSNNIADPTDSYFVKYFGTDGDQTGSDMFVNNDGTIILLGTSRYNSNNVGQAYLLKVDGRGEIIWEKFFTSTGSLTAMDIESTLEGNYFILCNEENLISGTDILVITVDQNGNEINARGSFTYAGVTNEIGVSVSTVTDTGITVGYIVAGSTNYNPVPNDNSDYFEKITALFVRFNSDGTEYTVAWNDHQSSNGEDYCTRVVQVSDLSNDPNIDPFLLFGYTNSDPTNPSFNFWSTRIDNFGNGPLLENGIIEGSPSTTDEKLGAVESIDKQGSYTNFLMTGIASNNSGADNIFIASNQLSLITARSITEINLGNLSALGDQSLEKVTSYPTSGGFIIAANSVLDGNSNINLIKISSSGELMWNKPVILGGAGEDYECSVYVTADKKIIVFGTMSLGDDGQKKMALIKLNEYGQFH